MPNYYNPYQPNYQPMYQAPIQQPVQQPVPQVQQQPQMTNGGFMSVRSEQEARNYPVAPGNVMTFKIENQPYVCEKAQGFSQLEGPVFNKYRLVKEEDVVEATQETVEQSTYDDSQLWQELKSLKAEISELKKKVSAKPKTLTKKLVEVEEDE